MQETWIGSGLGQEDPLEKEMASHSSILAWEIQGQRSLAGYRMATHSSVLAWRIPGTGEPGGLLSMGSYRVGHD